MTQIYGRFLKLPNLFFVEPMRIELITVCLQSNLASLGTCGPLMYSYQDSNLELLAYQASTLPLSYMSKCTRNRIRTYNLDDISVLLSPLSYTSIMQRTGVTIPYLHIDSVICIHYTTPSVYLCTPNGFRTHHFTLKG